MKKATLIYLVSYLSFGGIGLAFFPGTILALFLATGDYGDVMPRVVGMFMIVLAFLVAMFIRNNDYRYYLPTIIARTFIVLFLAWLYLRTNDPFFIVINLIVLIGLVPSAYVFFRARA